MTQEQLAGLADVSPSWLSKAERGVPLDRRMGPLSRIADVLGVSVGELIGQRLPRRTPLPQTRGLSDGDLDGLRRALLPAEQVPLRHVVDGAAETWRLRRECRYSALAALLPGLVVHGEQARRDVTGQDRVPACEALATIYGRVSWLSEQVGQIELAAAAVALATRVAEDAGSPTLQGIVACRRSLVLIRMGHEAQALDVCTAAAAEIEEAPRTASAEETAVHGSLLLHSAHAAARSGDAGPAAKLLADAEHDAHRFGLDRTYPLTAFGLGNVLLHRIWPSRAAILARRHARQSGWIQLACQPRCTTCAPATGSTSPERMRRCGEPTMPSAPCCAPSGSLQSWFATTFSSGRRCASSSAASASPSPRGSAALPSGWGPPGAEVVPGSGLASR